MVEEELLLSSIMKGTWRGGYDGAQKARVTKSLAKRSSVTTHADCFLATSNSFFCPPL